MASRRSRRNAHRAAQKQAAKTTSAITPPLAVTDIADVAKAPTPESFFSAMHGMILKAGRETQPSNYNPFANVPGSVMHGYFWLPKRQPQTIDIEDMDAYAWSPGSLLNILIDISPDVAKSLWNRLRMTGSEVTFKAFSLDGKEDGVGQKYIDEAISKINPDYGGLDNVINQMILSQFCWGASATDHAILEDISGVDDLFVVNPDSIYFEREGLKQYPIPYQLQYMWGMGQPEMQRQAVYNQTGGADYPQDVILPFRRLNLARFTYTPFDPGIDDPYGRSPAWPALQVVFFMAQLLRDLQRVMENQAWPHTDFELDWEILKDMMNRVSPEELNSPQKLAAFIRSRINEVQHQYNSLEPRMAFVHPSYLKINQNTKGGSLEGIDDIVVVVRREIAKALKEVPLFMDMDESVNGDVAAAQFEIYVHGIERTRQIVQNHIIKHLSLNCWLHGHDCKVVASWQPVRSTQRLSDAQAERVEIGNEQMKRDNGWQDNHQASKKVTGTDSVSEPDWEHLVSQKQGGTGEAPSGKDKNTSQKTSKGSLHSKNAREFTDSGSQPSWVSRPEFIEGDPITTPICTACGMTEEFCTCPENRRVIQMRLPEIELPDINITLPDVHVAAPAVTVVTPTPEVHVAAAPSQPVIEFKPNVIVEAPIIPEARIIDNTKPAPRPAKPKRVRKEVIRDEQGIIAETIENYEYED